VGDPRQLPPADLRRRRPRRRYRRFIRDDIAGNLLYEAARILDEDLARPEAAATLHLELARVHPDSPLFDDALWLAAGIRRKQKRFADAILIYNKLLATREDAFGGASYLSEWMDDSQMAIAQIWLLDFRQPKRAQAEFRKVITGFDRSVLRDDAQFWIVLCEVERGRLAQARRALRKLKLDYPDSRYVRRDAGLDHWYAFRRAARAKRSAEACRHWARLRGVRPRPWLARHAPKLPPWPACASTKAVPRPGPGRDA
jgi:tetratricopeptide (TPR) repeat protein